MSCEKMKERKEKRQIHLYAIFICYVRKINNKIKTTWKKNLSSKYEMGEKTAKLIQTRACGL